MNRILSAPGKFIIGKGELGNLAEHIRAFGSPIMLVAYREDADRVRAALDKVTEDGVVFVESNFSGECTKAEIERIRAICREKGCTAAMGLGGGKAIDTAKSVAHFEKLPSIIVPTIAASDAPCSKLAVIYDENHVLVDTYVFPKNPDMVVVDSEIIAKAPARFLVAGMGDAFATYYEGRACVRASAPNYNKAGATRAAMVLAEECHRILLADSHKALLACRAGVVTPALENIIEANVLLSGIGFESAGLACAHAIHGGLTAIPEAHSAMHGEKVAIGTLVQLILENVPADEMRQVLNYYAQVGLPITLRDIGITEPTEEKLHTIATRSCRPGGIMHHMPFPVTEDMVYDALIYLDSLQHLL